MSFFSDVRRVGYSGLLQLPEDIMCNQTTQEDESWDSWIEDESFNLREIEDGCNTYFGIGNPRTVTTGSD